MSYEEKPAKCGHVVVHINERTYHVNETSPFKGLERE